MLDYTGTKCPVCGEAFKQEDDIVVCPQCGAPYHRACYQKEGKCIFDDLHEAGKDWEPPAPPPPKAADTTAEIKDQECPVCGTLNAHSALFCNRCGTSLPGTQPGEDGGKPPHAPPFSPYDVPPTRNAWGGVVPPFSFDPMGGVSPAETLEEGVSFGDASKFVRQNTAYYMPVFRYIRRTGRNRFNFAAFLFSGAWMLYRKQYKAGAAVEALILGLLTAFFFLLFTVSLPIIFDLGMQAGVDLTQVYTPTPEQSMAIAQLLSSDTDLFFRVYAPYLLLLVVLIIKIVVGVRGNRMYMSHCVRSVRQIKNGSEGSDPSVTLEKEGGVNTPLAICLLVCYFMLFNAVMLL